MPKLVRRPISVRTREDPGAAYNASVVDRGQATLSTG
jgi:hypothetical protein